MNWTRTITILILSIFAGWGLAEVFTSIFQLKSEAVVVEESVEKVDNASAAAISGNESPEVKKSIFEQLSGQSDSYANDFNGGWRRTANGWEHMSSWPRPYEFRQPALHPLVFVAAQLLIILLVTLVASPEMVGNVRRKLISTYRQLKEATSLKSAFSSEDAASELSSDSSQLNSIRFADHRIGSNRQNIDS